jgi:nucleoside diphosphate kinase
MRLTNLLGAATSSPDTQGLNWSCLTTSETKRAIFEVDGDFRYAVHRIRSVGLSPERVAHEYGFLIFKPEVFYGRTLAVALSFLENLGLEIALVYATEFTNSVISQVWRYHFNAATPCRLDLIFDVLERRPVAGVLVRRRDSRQATSRFLSSLKGKSEGGVRDPATLRGVFGGANSFLNFVHSSDEPADVLREAPAVLQSVGMREWLERCRDNCYSPAVVWCERLAPIYATVEESDNKPEAAWKRLRQQLSEADVRLPIEELVDNVKRGKGWINARWLIDQLQPYRGLYSDWDLYLTLSEFTDRTYPGVEQTISKTSSRIDGYSSEEVEILRSSSTRDNRRGLKLRRE